MLDLTGVDAPERPELTHLVVQSVRNIENTPALRQNHAPPLRLNWAGYRLGECNDGLVGLDGNGFVTTSNSAGRQLLSQLGYIPESKSHRAHAGELFAVAVSLLFDAAQNPTTILDLPLWWIAS